MMFHDQPVTAFYFINEGEPGRNLDKPVFQGPCERIGAGVKRNIIMYSQVPIVEFTVQVLILHEMDKVPMNGIIPVSYYRRQGSPKHPVRVIHFQDIIREARLDCCRPV